MRGLTISAHGGLDQLVYRTDLPKPEPKRITRNDTIADRRGRSIPVTRVHTEKPQRPAPGKHRGQPRRSDRSRGPRPHKPR